MGLGTVEFLLYKYDAIRRRPGSKITFSVVIILADHRILSWTMKERRKLMVSKKKKMVSSKPQTICSTLVVGSTRVSELREQNY